MGCKESPFCSRTDRKFSHSCQSGFGNFAGRKYKGSGSRPRRKTFARIDLLPLKKSFLRSICDNNILQINKQLLGSSQINAEHLSQKPGQECATTINKA